MTSPSFSFAHTVVSPPSPTPPASSVIHQVSSPNKARIKVLSARIAGVHADRESERQTRQDQLGSELRVTEDHLARRQIDADGNCKLTKERLNKVHESLASETVALKVLGERQSKELDLADSNFKLESKYKTRKLFFIFIFSIVILMDEHNAYYSLFLQVVRRERRGRRMS